MQNNAFYSNITLNLRGKLLTLGAPRVMGILNVTPDSFYEGSRSQTDHDILERAATMVKEGADFLDIGGYSTRPGAATISEEEEIRRVMPAIHLVTQHFPEIPVSIDTFRASVASKAVESGASMINDVSGGEADPKMFETVAALGVPYILMHMRGTPETMATLTHYDHLLKDITHYFDSKISKLRNLGVHDIILDPGFGFAKTVEQNFELLNRLEWFQIFGLPLLAGLSRKSMIWRTLSTTPEAALNGTTGLHMLALNHGASMLRVHDVKEAVECIALYQKTKQPNPL